MFLSRCVPNDSRNKKIVTEEQQGKFTGSLVCKNCHADIYESHLQTFHHQTSQLASLTSIKGSIDSGKNTFFFDQLTYIAIERKGDSLFQTAYKHGEKVISRPFDFAVGSGKRGQTFLYWYNNYIFQLPLTWFTSANEWTNSPGYSNKVEFNRPVTARCLECHSTYFQQENNPGAKADEFSKSQIILGVECERCHGPGSDHVDYHEKNPKDSVAHYIINTGRLSRKQNLDLCRFCHGGRLTKSQPSFSYEAGDKLSDYFHLDTATTNISDIDVHGNQYGMLSKSKCFTMSDMTCITCHDAHKNESKSLEVFTQKCINCHNNANNKVCKLTGKTNQAFLINNCIDCHMPEQPSKAIMVLRQGESIPTSAFMRSHYISVYPEVSQKKMELVRQKTKN